MNVIARLEYELAYYDSAVHRFNHYITRIPPSRNERMHKAWMVARLKTRVNQKFCNILVEREVQFDSSLCFCLGCDCDDPHWTVRCQARPILSKCKSLDLSIWFWARPRNLRFSAYLTLPHCRGSCNSSEISWTI